MQILYQGTAKRRVAQTNINRESSRSHSVLTCSVESKATDANGITNILHARLNLVDLAGGRTIACPHLILPHASQPHCLLPVTSYGARQSIWQDTSR